MQLELGEEGGEEILVIDFDLDSGPARVGARSPDLHIDHAVLGARVDDGVEDLGEDQRVDDVAFDLDDLGCHQFDGGTGSGSNSEIGISSVPIVGSSLRAPFRWS